MTNAATVNAPGATGVERRIEAFEAAWEAGASVDVVRFLPSEDDPDYLPTLCELIRVSLELSWARGRPLQVTDFRHRFPAVFARPDLAGAIEFEDRRLRAQFPTLAGTGFVELTPMPAGERISGAAGQKAIAPPDRPVLPDAGELFHGFQLREVLGTGTFGRVFLAHQRALSDRPVALKVMAQPNREAQNLARLQHTNIVPILSAHQFGPLQAVCMPYYGRTTLRQVLDSVRGLKELPTSGRELISTLRASVTATEVDSPRQPAVPDRSPIIATVAPAPTREMLADLPYGEAVVWIMARLADGLAHAHSRGILHRDLKPENVLLADDGQPMLLDFNLADDGSGGGSGRVGGTLMYMAPEHLRAFTGDRSQPIDARSDLYALGLIFYELLSARHPSPVGSGSGNPVEALQVLRQSRPLSLRSWNPDASAAVNAVVLRLLEPNPADRYQSARHLQEDLDRHLAHLPLLHISEPSLVERAQKWSWRNPRAVPTVGLSLAVVVALGLGAAVFKHDRARRHAEVNALASATAVQEARETAEATALHAAFRKDLQTARVLLTACAGDPATQSAGTARVRDALGRYAVLDNSKWEEETAVSRLGVADREALRAEVGEALFLLARTAERGGDRAGAFHFLGRAQDCFPPSAVPAVLGRERAELAGQLGHAEEARQLRDALASARDAGPNDAYLEGVGQAITGRWAEAVGPLEMACRLDPQHLASTFALGYTYDALGRDAEALECYRACTALRKDFPWPHLNRGIIYLRRGEHGRALADLDEAVRLAPDWADAYFTRGTLHQRMGSFAKALADYNGAEELHTPRTRLFFLRSQVRAKLNDAAGAAADRAKGLATPPADESDYLARGVAYLPAEPKNALADFEQAAVLNPRSLTAYQNKSHVLSTYLHRDAEAVKTLDKAVETYPSFVPARAGRAVLLARLGKRKEAQRDATESLRRDTSPFTLYQLAGVYAITSKDHSEDRREALRLLAAAFTAGFRDFTALDGDHDLDAIRGRTEFSALVAEFRPTAEVSKENH
ncbi:serine/threonine-protein kinase [Limnoglobus roseus]|uniref:Tetratricopeptide repeat protein n=1 Tax=Limnoglobus roseus TaxID=2598579 RepID=A0A5C1ANE5_9BACT|nr:serine/threonine-protein kinase [Limnoglobus roseus]QEL19516.1 tetratricopeptide repeat protein [Limnoglobus roseus]